MSKKVHTTLNTNAMWFSHTPLSLRLSRSIIKFLRRSLMNFFTSWGVVLPIVKINLNIGLTIILTIKLNIKENLEEIKNFYSMSSY